jgi:peptidoglycan/LPS O-acetylase OafA/YrhL
MTDPMPQDDVATDAGVRGSASGLPTSFGHKPALDGLRAVAVLSVMAFHYGLDGLQGGFLGVDTFFVLSGYLITSLLLTEWGRTATVNLLAFWTRRAKRLLPALFIVLIAVAIWVRLESSSDSFLSLRADLIWTLFYGANWHFIGSGQSYFDLSSEASPLRHAWSLAIEEQFYLLWPLITFACLRLGRGRTRALTTVCVGGIVASTALMAALYNAGDPSRAYFGTDTRASQLLVGALLAVILARWAPRTTAQRRGVQATGIAGAIFCVWAFTSVTDRDAWLYHGGFLLFAIATAFVIVAIIEPARSPLTALLSVRAVRWVGQVSYGLYLWHWPVQIFLSEARTGMSGWSLGLVRVAVTFTATTLSYYLVEIPIRHHTFRSQAAKFLVPAGFLAVTFITLVATAGATTAPDFLTAAPNQVLHSATPATTPATQPGTPPPAVGQVLLLGDSVASSLSDALQAEAARRGITFTSATRPGCGMVTGVPALDDGTPVAWGKTCEDSTNNYLSGTVQLDKPQVVLWLSTWEDSDRIVDGTDYKFGTPAADRVLLAKLEDSRKLVTATGARILLLTNPPRAEHSDVIVHDPAEDVKLEHLNDLYRQFAALHPEDVAVVGLDKIVCPGGAPCPEYVDGLRLRPRDGGHFEGDGPGYVAPRLLDAVLAAVTARSALSK